MAVQSMFTSCVCWACHLHEKICIVHIASAQKDKPTYTTQFICQIIGVRMAMTLHVVKAKGRRISLAMACGYACAGALNG